jgi:hypothetical protein
MIDIKPVNIEKNSGAAVFHAWHQRFAMAIDSNNLHACLCADCG